jgi:ABC-type multidrug transport system ATPase subunit
MRAGGASSLHANRLLYNAAVIQVANFHKSYKTTVAVEDLSFEVLPGQVLGLLGPNGAGKTTTMRAIAGIIPPTRGRLFVGGMTCRWTRSMPSGGSRTCPTTRNCSKP